MSREERIKSILAQLNPVTLDLKNDSAKHAGHAEHLGSAGFTGETHYKLKIVSEVFNGLGRVDRQRKVYDLLRSEFNSGLHALELKTLTPQEASS
jgi:stress-induced morphogen